MSMKRNNMNILVFGLSSVHGGVESVILSFCKEALIHRICKFDFIVIDKVPSFAEFFADEFNCNFIIVPNRIRHPFKYANALKNAVRGKRYDYVWFNACTLSDLTLLKIAKSQGIKCILHSHNSENMGNMLNKMLHYCHKKIICQYVDVYCACSTDAAAFMFPEGIYSDTDRWLFVKNGIKMSSFKFDFEARKQIRKRYGLEDAILIGNIGRLHFQKNQKFAIEIIDNLHKSNPNLRLLLFGVGPLRNELESFVKYKKLENIVFFMGEKSNINEWLSALDAFLFPSLYEGLPVSLLEAQASGLPCLVSDVIPAEAICTHSIKRESLNNNLDVWCSDMEELLKNRTGNDREKAWKDVSNAGFDVEVEAISFFKFLKQKIKFYDL